MSTITPPAPARSADTTSVVVFAAAALSVATAAGLLAGFAPLGFSIAIVFLFAGPHNWMEARYLLGRMPAKWGRLRPYFATGLFGAGGLAGAYIAMSFVGRWRGWTGESWSLATSLWITFLVVWLFALTQLRARIRPHRDWAWFTPIAFVLIALAWMTPAYWSLGLVYAHPLIALWYLDRELLRLRPIWRPTYHLCLLAAGAVLVMIWRGLMYAPDLPGQDLLTQQIADHAGASVVSAISSRCLVATHTFLEMLHYGVWLVALPLIGMKQAPWRLGSVPLARGSRRWTIAIACVLIGGGVAVLGFWCGFLANYPVTRDIYFTVAIFHVVVEAPFLLRSL